MKTSPNKSSTQYIQTRSKKFSLLSDITECDSYYKLNVRRKQYLTEIENQRLAEIFRKNQRKN